MHDWARNGVKLTPDTLECARLSPKAVCGARSGGRPDGIGSYSRGSDRPLVLGSNGDLANPGGLVCTQEPPRRRIDARCSSARSTDSTPRSQGRCRRAAPSLGLAAGGLVAEPRRDFLARDSRVGSRDPARLQWTRGPGRHTRRIACSRNCPAERCARGRLGARVEAAATRCVTRLRRVRRASPAHLAGQ